MLKRLSNNFICIIKNNTFSLNWWHPTDLIVMYNWQMISADYQSEIEALDAQFSYYSKWTVLWLSTKSLLAICFSKIQFIDLENENVYEPKFAQHLSNNIRCSTVNIWK